LIISSEWIYLIDLDRTIVASDSEFERWRDTCRDISCPQYQDVRVGNSWCSMGAKLSCFQNLELKERGIFGDAATSKLSPIEPARKALQKMRQAYYVSGRGESQRGVSLDWLENHGFPMFRLYLRLENDIRSIPQVKKEIFQVLRAVYGKDGETWCVIDDDARVLEVCQEIGMEFLQAPECWEWGESE